MHKKFILKIFEHKNQTVFHGKIPKSTFGIPCKDMCCLLYNANIVMDISDIQQKYVKVKSLLYLLIILKNYKIRADYSNELFNVFYIKSFL